MLRAKCFPSETVKRSAHPQLKTGKHGDRDPSQKQVCHCVYLSVDLLFRVQAGARGHPQLGSLGPDEGVFMACPPSCSVPQVGLLGSPPPSGPSLSDHQGPRRGEHSQLPRAPPSQVEGSGKLLAVPIRGCLEPWSVKCLSTGLSYACRVSL